MSSTANEVAGIPSATSAALNSPAAYGRDVPRGCAHDLGELVGNNELNRDAQDLARRCPVLAQRALPCFTTSRA
jgi:hypothetical protein